MELVKFNPTRAEKLGSALSAISNKAEMFGYLTGLIQDVTRCITANVKTDEELSDSDAKVIDDVLLSLSNAESGLSCFMSESLTESSKE